MSGQINFLPAVIDFKHAMVIKLSRGVCDMYCPSQQLEMMDTKGTGGLVQL